MSRNNLIPAFLFVVIDVYKPPIPAAAEMVFYRVMVKLIYKKRAITKMKMAGFIFQVCVALRLSD
ncbi:hypothetical protein SAMN05428949_3315 [Chitinophaga sp. YR627]|nr:hypothetical protein SAMN05428949_3315 [Chitinophaga sp. YR627]